MNTIWSRIGVVMLLVGAFFCLQPAVAQEESAEAATAQGDLQPIKVELPEPSYMGTPLDYWSEHLELSLEPRKPVMAPAGTSNIAKGLLVTASAEPTTGSLAIITDGKKGADEGMAVELPEGVQWIQLDLGKPHNIYAILFWHFIASERVYFDTVVQVSNDPEFKEGVTTLYNNDYDNTSKLGVGEQKEYVDNFEGRQIDAKGVKAQYLRFYSNGNTSDDKNHYVEAEVYAQPAE